MRSPSCRSRSAWRSRATRSRRRVSRSAEWRTSRGATVKPKRSSTERRQRRRASRARPRPCWEKHAASATTTSRSSWRGAASCVHRPKLASSDEKYADEVAPPGSPFRPLYDDRILFNGQPVALVVAEEFEIARFAASLVRVEYERETHVTDFEAQRKRAKPAKQDD